MTEPCYTEDWQAIADSNSHLNPGKSCGISSQPCRHAQTLSTPNVYAMGSHGPNGVGFAPFAPNQYPYSALNSILSNINGHATNHGHSVRAAAARQVQQPLGV